MTAAFHFGCVWLIALVSFLPGSCCFVESFLAPTTTSVRTTCRSSLWMAAGSSSTLPSRRELFRSSVAAAVAIPHPDAAQAAFLASAAPITEQSAANKANESYQGVYFDPNHPNGYRVIMAVKGNTSKATLTLSDGGIPTGSNNSPQTFRGIPVAVSDDELVFDFGFKGGPKNIKAKLSPDKQSLTFQDGNTWTKNYYRYDGIYKVTSGGDPSLSKDNAYRIIRKNGPEMIVEMNDTGNPKDSYFVDGSVGTLFSIPTSSLTFYFEGKSKASSEYSFMDALYDFQRGNEAPTSASSGGTVVGQLSLQDRNTVFPYGTITFPDKTVWTRI